MGLLRRHEPGNLPDLGRRRTLNQAGAAHSSAALSLSGPALIDVTSDSARTEMSSRPERNVVERRGEISALPVMICDATTVDRTRRGEWHSPGLRPAQSRRANAIRPYGNVVSHRG